MRLSVVIPTKNEEANIGACIDAFTGFASRVDIIVVDNFSTDQTREIAAAKGATVLLKGPERCAQRNRGWKESQGEYVLFVDADMIVPRETILEILEHCANPGHKDPIDAWYVREVRSGNGMRIAARNFERSFYDGTCIDGLRVIRRSLLQKVGGYDENLIACEDWDLDRRLIQAGAKTAVTNGHLFHNEARQNLKTFLKKKAYYSASVDCYRQKWQNDATCRQQFGLYYRYLGVFIEHGKWRRLLSHPLLAFVMYLERVAVGVTYLANRARPTK